MTVREDLTVPARFGKKLWCSYEGRSVTLVSHCPDSSLCRIQLP